MEDVKWGVPSQAKAKKVEKYDTPVVTMAALSKKGANRKLSFNKAAREALNLVGGETNIAFGFNGENSICISTFKKPDAYTFVINKGFGLRDKRTFEYISKILELDSKLENELHFHKEELEDQVYLNYVSYTNADKVVTVLAVEESDEDVTLAPVKKKEKAKELTEDLDSQW